MSQIITKEEVKAFADLPATLDTLIDALIKSCDKYLENKCHNVINKVTGIVEVFDGDDLDGDIFLNNRLSIANVVLKYNSGEAYNPTWTVCDASEFVTYTKEGRIALLKSRTGLMTYQVTYDAGWATADVPDDLKLAAKKLVAGVANKRKSEGANREALGDANIDWGKMFSDDIKELISPYLSVVMV